MVRHVIPQQSFRLCKGKACPDDTLAEPHVQAVQKTATALRLL